MSVFPKIYKNKILKGEFNFSDLPEKYIDDVKYLLRQDVESGKITPERYEEITGEPYNGDKEDN